MQFRRPVQRDEQRAAAVHGQQEQCRRQRVEGGKSHEGSGSCSPMYRAIRSSSGRRMGGAVYRQLRNRDCELFVCEYEDFELFVTFYDKLFCPLFEFVRPLRHTFADNALAVKSQPPGFQDRTHARAGAHPRVRVASTNEHAKSTQAHTTNQHATHPHQQTT